MCHVFQRIAESHVVWYDSPIKTAEQRMDYYMEIRKVETNKKRYLNLLLLADEQEDMVDRYLERGIHLRVRGTDGGYGVSAKETMRKAECLCEHSAFSL